MMRSLSVRRDVDDALAVGGSVQMVMRLLPVGLIGIQQVCFQAAESIGSINPSDLRVRGTLLFLLLLLLISSH